MAGKANSNSNRRLEYCDAQVFDDACQSLVDAGISVVVAAGNEGAGDSPLTNPCMLARSDVNMLCVLTSAKSDSNFEHNHTAVSRSKSTLRKRIHIKNIRHAGESHKRLPSAFSWQSPAPLNYINLNWAAAI